MFDILKRVFVLFVCCVCVGGVGFAQIDTSYLDEADWRLHDNLTAYQVSMIAQEAIIYFGIQTVKGKNMQEDKKMVNALMDSLLSGSELQYDEMAADKRVEALCKVFEKKIIVKKLYNMLYTEIEPLYENDQLKYLSDDEDEIVDYISQDLFKDWCNGDARRVQWIRRDMKEWKMLGDEGKDRFFENEELSKTSDLLKIIIC